MVLFILNLVGVALCDTMTQPIGQIFVSASPDSYVAELQVSDLLEPFEWFVIAQYPFPVAMESFSVSLTVPPEITILSGYPFESLALGTTREHCLFEFEHYVGARLTGILTAAVTEPITISVAPGTTLAFQVPSPGWSECRSAEPHPYEPDWPTNSLTIHFQPVAAVELSWGSIKALFDD